MAEYSICNCLRTDKPLKRNGKYSIYLRVRVGDRSTKIPSGLDVFFEQWNVKTNTPKSKPLLILLSQKIMDLDSYLCRCMVEGKTLSLDLVKSFYKKEQIIKPEQCSFYEYYLSFVERKRKEGLNPETIRVYMTTYRVMQSFKNDFRICDISLDLIEKFDEYMKFVNGNSAGGRHPKHKNLRTVILDISKHNIPVDDPYKWFKVQSAEPKEIYLERSELDKLVKYRELLEKYSMGYRVLSMYLFSCYCGLRFSDVLDLEWKNVDFENNLIRKTMIKTKTQVITPIFPMAREILLEKFTSKELQNTNLKVFEKITEPVVNRSLRKCVSSAGITKYLSYHSSRHTFATLLVIDKVDIYTVSKYLGHSSVTMTQRYLKYDLSIAKESAKNISTFSSVISK